MRGQNKNNRADGQTGVGVDGESPAVWVRGLKSVCGHARVIDFLRAGLDAEKLAHAYLFAGPSGVGKTTVATALAQAFNCPAAPGRGCGTCSVCTRIARKVHPDYVEVEPDGRYIRVAQVRELETRVELGAHEGHVLVVVLTPADRMNTAAANALLKTLEEPKSGVCFVLASAAPHALLATVRSRCQILRFGPLAHDDVLGFLIEKLGFSREKAALPARLAEGSIGRALDLAQRVDLYESRRRVLEVLRKTHVRPQPTALFALAETLSGLKDELETFLEYLRLCLRDLAWNGAGSPSLQKRILDRELVAELGDQLNAFPPRVYLSWDRAVERSLRALNANANRKLTMEQMLIELAER